MNNVIKRLLAVCFVICLLFSLVACDDKEVKPSATPEAVQSGTPGAEKPDNPNGTEFPQTPAPEQTPAPGQTQEPEYTPAGGYTPNPDQTFAPGQPTAPEQTLAPGQTPAPGTTGTQSNVTNPPWSNTTAPSTTQGLPYPTDDNNNDPGYSYVAGEYANRKIFGDFVPENAHITLISYPDAEHIAGKLTYYSDVVVDGVNFRNIITITGAHKLIDRKMSMETGLGAPGVTHTIALEIHGEADKVEAAKSKNKHILTDAGFTSAEADDILNGKEMVILKGMKQGILELIAPFSFGKMSATVGGQRLLFTELEADSFFPESQNVSVYYDSREFVQQVTFINQAGNKKTVDNYQYNDMTGEKGYLAVRETYTLKGGEWVLESSTRYDEHGNEIKNPQDPTDQPTTQPTTTTTSAPTPTVTDDLVEQEYYDTGELKSETVYSNKKKENWVKTEYNKDGTVSAEYTYSQSRLFRQKIYQYNSDGAFIEQTTYQYDKSGNVSSSSYAEIQYYKDGSRREVSNGGKSEMYYDKDDVLFKRIKVNLNGSITEETWEGDIHTEISKNAKGVAISKTVTKSNSYGKPLLITNYNINRVTGEDILQSTWEYTYRDNGISKLTAVYKNEKGQIERSEQYTYNSNGTMATMRATNGKSTLLEEIICDGNGTMESHYNVTRNANGDVTGATKIEYFIKGYLQSVKSNEYTYDADGVLLSLTKYDTSEKKTHYIEYYANGEMKVQHCYDPDTGAEYRCIEYYEDGSIKSETDY